MEYFRISFQEKNLWSFSWSFYAVALVILKIDQEFHNIYGKYLCRSLFFNKVAGRITASVNFAKFLRTYFLKNISGWLIFDLLEESWEDII